MQDQARSIAGAMPGHTENNELRRGWRALLACVIGMITSAAVVPLYSFGPLMAPLEQNFGWSRGDIQIAISLFFVGLVLAAPVAGWLVGRFGPRRSALLSLFGQSLAYAALARLPDQLWLLYLLYLLIPVAGAGTLQVTWTQLTSTWFVRNRGLALAVMLSGTGLCALLVTPLVALAIEQGGWRLAMWLLAALPLAVTLPALLLLLPADTPPPSTRDSEQPAAADAELPQLPLRGIARQGRFWLITLGLSLTVVGIVGLVTNTVPILQDKGVAGPLAASIFSVMGASIIVGRTVAGYLIDRLWAPGVAFVCLTLPAIGCLILGLEQETLWLFVLAAALIGLGAGAEVDFAAFLIARYFGLASYSRAFSLCFATGALFTCLAPLLFGRLYDITGNYDAMLWVCGATFVIGPLLLLALGPYPAPEPRKQP